MTEVKVHMSERLSPKHRKDAELMMRVDSDNPSKKDIAALRELFKETHGLARALSDMSTMAADILIADMSKNSRLQKEALQRSLFEMKADLGYKNAPTIERLLIENVVLSWLRWTAVEAMHASHAYKSIAITQAEFWERRLSSTQLRYTRAVESLARVRKLTGSITQINIAADGGQQINVAKT